MNGINKLAIVAAAVAAFVASSVWYAVYGNATMELSSTGQDAAANIANAKGSTTSTSATRSLPSS